MNLLFKFLIVFFTFSRVVYSQNIYKASYRVNIVHDVRNLEVSDTIKDEKYRVLLLKSVRTIEKGLTAAKKFHFILEFDKHKSIFYLPPDFITFLA